MPFYTLDFTFSVGTIVPVLNYNFIYFYSYFINIMVLKNCNCFLNFFLTIKLFIFELKLKSIFYIFHTNVLRKRMFTFDQIKNRSIYNN